MASKSSPALGCSNSCNALDSVAFNSDGMNNAVYLRGECIGYRCFTCGEIFQSMWDCTCNSCRQKEKQHREHIKAINELAEAIRQQTPKP